MILKTHAVENYRNITAAEFAPSSGVTVICGENGQGKTNLLESVWLLCGSKSFRTAKDDQLILKGQSEAKINAVLETESEGEKAVRILIGAQDAQKPGRHAWVNGVPFGRATALAGEFGCVVFSPSHMALVQGGPDGRRRFLDAALCQVMPRYLDTLRRYNRFLKQKNAMLKNKNRSKESDALLDVLDENLAQHGSEMRLQRALYVENLAPIASENYKELTREKETFDILYKPGKTTKDELFDALVSARAASVLAGVTTVGPHRDDLSFEINGASGRVFASQGQQRSAAVCLKLAEAACLAKASGVYPLTLLDDVLSELDAHRQNYLLNQLEKGQVILTCCDASLFQSSTGALYEMNAGVLTRKG